MGPCSEVVICGEAGAGDTAALLRAVRGRFLPRTVVAFRPPDAPPELLELLPYAEAMGPRDGKAAAYLCRDYTCESPVTSPEALARALEG